ncbi:MAG: aldo/keto reductase [Planctomycetota bacterium]|nr:aldo/keto reductase [Planctomycetota bacterium]
MQQQLTLPGLALGCWPLAGMTRPGVTRQAAIETVAAAIDHGITHLDTAYCYGENGESEKAIAQAAQGRRNEVTIASKCGIHWQAGKKQTVDGRPETIIREAKESLLRLQADTIDLLYLHTPDPKIPIKESAGALRRLLDEGVVRAVGLSNGNVEECKLFAETCPLTACQRHFNMLQQEIRPALLPYCKSEQIAMVTYWPLIKGLLTGRMERNQVFQKTDSRHKYLMFHGEEFQKNLDFVDTIRSLATQQNMDLVSLVLAWTMAQEGITTVLFGATSAKQVAANAKALNCRLESSIIQAINDAIQQRGLVLGSRKV